MATAGVEATEVKGKNMQTETRWMGNSDNTSGVNKTEEKQNIRREPESQPGQGNRPHRGRREQ